MYERLFTLQTAIPGLRVVGRGRGAMCAPQLYLGSAAYARTSCVLSSTTSVQ